MSFFHTAAQPKVQLRKRAEHLIRYIKAERGEWSTRLLSASIDIQDTLEDIVTMLNGNPDSETIAVARESIESAEYIFPNAASWIAPIDDGTLLAITSAIASTLYLLMAWAYWNAEPEPPETLVVYTMPVFILEKEQLFGVSNAQAAA